MSDLILGQPHTFTLGEAAKAAGISKPSLTKAIANGRLTAEKKSDGSYSIQAGELFRVYPPNRKANPVSHAGIGDGLTGEEAQATGGLLQSEVNRLHENLANLTAERDRERRQLTDQIDDLRKRLDQEGEERRKLTAILTDQRAKAVEPVQPARGGFWAFFRGVRGRG